MNRKEILIEQFKAGYNQNNWFVSFKHSIVDLTPEQAAWKGFDTTNTILEIVTHITFWNERYLNRFNGRSVEELSGTNDVTFTTPENQDWNTIVDKMHSVSQEWIEALEGCEDSRLDEAVGDSPVTWAAAISNMVIHQAYHVGQIIHIRKQQGSWDSKNGVH